MRPASIITVQLLFYFSFLQLTGPKREYRLKENLRVIWWWFRCWAGHFGAYFGIFFQLRQGNEEFVVLSMILEYTTIKKK